MSKEKVILPPGPLVMVDCIEMIGPAGKIQVPLAQQSNYEELGYKVAPETEGGCADNKPAVDWTKVEIAALRKLALANEIKVAGNTSREALIDALCKKGVEPPKE